MTHPLLKEAVSELLHERADEHGVIVGLASDDIALAVHTHNSKIRGLIRELIAEQRLVCLSENRGNRCAVYRLVDERAQKDTSHEIETVIRMMRRDTWSGNIVEIPVSLPRLRCLERPL